MVNARLRETLRSVYSAVHRTHDLASHNDRRVSRARCVTLDAFDTLITRPLLDPNDVFLITGAILNRASIIDLPPNEWKNQRHRTADRLIARAEGREVVLEEIYTALVEAGVLPAHRMQEAIEIEIETEVALIRPIHRNIDLLRNLKAAGKPVRILSDTHLPHQALHRLLAKCGVDIPPDDARASSQTRATKHHGALFAETARELAVPAREILHVGDNFRADVRRAIQTGMKAAQFSHGKRTKYEQDLAKRLGAEPLLASMFAGSARIARLSANVSTRHARDLWEISASVIAPLLTVYVLWCLREAVARGVQRLYFLSRDGEILLKIAQALAPLVSPDLECRYLHVSRQSLLLAGIRDIGPAERTWILSDAAWRTLDSQLARLDIERDEFAAVVGADSPLFQGEPKAWLGLAGAAVLADMLEFPQVRALILEKASRRGAVALEYLRQQNVLTPGGVGVVDVGWQGRLQASIVRLAEAEDPLFAERMHGFYVGIANHDTQSGTYTAYGPLALVANFNWAEREPLLEAFCAACHGTVRGYYREPDGHIAVELASPDNPEAEAWGLRTQQNAIEAFALELALAARTAQIDLLRHIEFLARPLQDHVRRFVEQPTLREARVYGAFPSPVDDRHETHEELAQIIRWTPKDLLRRARRKTRRISYWPEASLTRSAPAPARQLLTGAYRFTKRGGPGR